MFLLLSHSQALATDHQIEDVVFNSHGVNLSGAIVMPAQHPIRAAVVFVHGSGPQLKNMAIAERFAQDGIAALVYDKRGTGKSGGSYEGKQSVSESNIVLLADDAKAALNAFSKHPRLAGIPIGLTGISQAGWIVPLAAQKAIKDKIQIDFLAIWSGAVTKVSEEDIYSKYTADADGDAVPSFQHALNARRQPYVWPDFLGKDSDPSDQLVKLNVPSLWVFGASDGSIPVDLSIARLNILRQQGLPHSYVLFSDSGHNNMRETFATVNDWILNLPD